VDKNKKTPKRAQRIIHLNDSLDVGGAEVMILSLLSRINREKYNPSACSMSKNGALNKEFEKCGLPVYELPQKPGIDLTLFFRIAWLLARKKIDVIHTHNYFAWFYGGVASLMVPGCKHVHTQHADIIVEKKHPSIIRWLLARIPCAVVAVSEQVKSSLAKDQYVKRTTKVEVIVNGVDISKFIKSTTEERKTKELNGVVKIGIVARLSQEKNHGFLIKCFSKLLAQNKNVQLIMVGDGPLRENLENMVKSYNIGKYVQFIGQTNKVPAILNSFDIFVLPSKTEGLSIAILEAMASSLPIVATDVGGNRSLVESEVTGFLVEKDNEDKLVEAIKKLVENASLRCRLGEQGRKMVEEKFTLEEMTNRYQDLYDGLAS